MEREEIIINHKVELVDRKNIVISGIKKLESFDNKEFFILSLMGYMRVIGENLELVKLDTTNGNISIKGIINSISYIDDNNKESILSKLFK